MSYIALNIITSLYVFAYNPHTCTGCDPTAYRTAIAIFCFQPTHLYGLHLTTRKKRLEYDTSNPHTSTGCICKTVQKYIGCSYGFCV